MTVACCCGTPDLECIGYTVKKCYFKQNYDSCIILVETILVIIITLYEWLVTSYTVILTDLIHTYIYLLHYRCDNVASIPYICVCLVQYPDIHSTLSHSPISYNILDI